MLPVPGHDSVVADESVAKVLRGVLADEGIHLADLRVRQMRRIIVHGVQRHALVIPEDLNASDFEEDDLYPRKEKNDRPLLSAPRQLRHHPHQADCAGNPVMFPHFALA